MVYRRRREDEEDDDDFFGDMFDSFGIDFDRFNERMRRMFGAMAIIECQKFYVKIRSGHLNIRRF